MTDLQSLLRKIDSLHEQLEKLKPMKPKDEERLWKKFRLEWNYNSNHIEGNTLTLGETYLLLIKGEVTGDHKAQEIDEMRDHDIVVASVREYANEKGRELSEADIREWNKIILVRPYWKEAITQSGQATQKLIEPGKYKSSPNSVRLPNGELFAYASPEETPMLMSELMEWYRGQSSNKEMHTLELAALLHYKFVRIHPFDDGNGRTARLLMNYVLLKMGLPPVIVKSDDKKDYLFALSKADSGDLDSFIEYIGKQLVWSLELSLKAVKGESIEETDDIYKEIDVFKKESQKKLNEATPKTVEVIKELVDKSLGRLFEVLTSDQQQIDEFYARNDLSVEFEGNHNIKRDKDDFLKMIHKIIDESPGRINYAQNRIVIRFYRANLKTGTKEYFTNKSIQILLDGLGYEISDDRDIISIKKKYPHQLTDEEIGDFSKKILKASFNEIKAQA